MDTPAGQQQAVRVTNRHVASPPPQHPGHLNVTETIPVAGSTAAGHVNIHSGPEVQQHGHARLGDGRPVSEVREGKIHILTDANTQPAAETGAAHHGDRHHTCTSICPHHVHHTPDGGAVSDPPKDYLHEGTTYATGAAGANYVDTDPVDRPSLATRIKESLPGTKEHKARAEAEGNTAVYM